MTVALCKFTFTITITADYYTAQFVTYSDKIRKKMCIFVILQNSLRLSLRTTLQEAKAVLMYAVLYDVGLLS